MTDPVQHIDAYVDGSCDGNPGPAGFGIVLISGPHRKDLFGYIGVATNSVAELAGALVALRVIKDKAAAVRLFTDSAYVRGMITQNWKAKTNKRLIEALRLEAKRFTSLEVVHVPGHAGVKENERTDVLARMAVIRKDPVYELPEIQQGMEEV